MPAVCVNVPQALYRALRRAAEEEGVTVSELVRHALFHFLLHRRGLPPLPKLRLLPLPRRRRTVPLAVTLTPPLLARLDRAVRAGYFHSRAEAVRLALDLLLSQLEEREGVRLEVGYR